MNLEHCPKQVKKASKTGLNRPKAQLFDHIGSAHSYLGQSTLMLGNARNQVKSAQERAQKGRREQKARFDWLSATTPAIHDYRSVENLLGARFVDLVLPEPDRLAMAVRAADNSPNLEEIRVGFKSSAGDVMNFAKNQAKGAVNLKPDEAALFAGWADLTALARSPVARDHSHNLQSPPAAEVGTDLAQTFTRIAKGLTIMGVSNIKPYIAKLAWDCIPTFRVEMITKILEGGSLAQISTSAGARFYEKENLLLLGLTKPISKEAYGLVPDLEARFKVMASHHANTHDMINLI